MIIEGVFSRVGKATEHEIRLIENSMQQKISKKGKGARAHMRTVDKNKEAILQKKKTKKDSLNWLMEEDDGERKVDVDALLEQFHLHRNVSAASLKPSTKTVESEIAEAAQKMDEAALLAAYDARLAEKERQKLADQEVAINNYTASIRPSSSFLTTSREKQAKLLAPPREGPPVGMYEPKFTFTRRRSPSPLPLDRPQHQPRSPSPPHVSVQIDEAERRAPHEVIDSLTKPKSYVPDFHREIPRSHSPPPGPSASEHRFESSPFELDRYNRVRTVDFNRYSPRADMSSRPVTAPVYNPKFNLVTKTRASPGVSFSAQVSRPSSMQKRKPFQWEIQGVELDPTRSLPHLSNHRAEHRVMVDLSRQSKRQTIFDQALRQSASMSDLQALSHMQQQFNSPLCVDKLKSKSTYVPDLSLDRSPSRFELEPRPKTTPLTFSSVRAEMGLSPSSSATAFKSPSRTKQKFSAADFGFRS
eukprot:GILI01013166.1.p1 GENE.GILI01013166.1~~GILI01013166.1.p1  ORF type:complete len:473 (+),score=68.10 GILI01013166.1:97-1515(+)